MLNGHFNMVSRCEIGTVAVDANITTDRRLSESLLTKPVHFMIGTHLALCHLRFLIVKAQVRALNNEKALLGTVKFREGSLTALPANSGTVLSVSED